MSTINLRPYQHEAHQIAVDFYHSDMKRGQIYAPTGSGKTTMYFKLIEYITNKSHDFPLRICILHPRIALSQEQQKRFKNTFGSDKFVTTAFHSGQGVRGMEQIKEISTTNVDDLKCLMQQDVFKHHVTFCVYDSFKKLVNDERDPIEFDLIIADEGHNFTHPEFSKLLPNIRAKKILFYTATPINSKTIHDESFGMDNILHFGDILYRIEPKQLIQDNYIVPPAIHFLTAQTDNQNSEADVIEVVANAFIKQSQENVKHGLRTTKMLVASRGYTDHKELEQNVAHLRALVGNDVNLYTIECNNSRLNGDFVFPSREDALNHLNNNPHNAIIVHYDTISEGIDIESLTGALILRTLRPYKFIQTIGRCARLAPNKKFSIITLPNINSTQLGGDNAKDLIDAFIEGGYGQLVDYIMDCKEVAIPEEIPDPDEFIENEVSYASLIDLEWASTVNELFEKGVI